MILPNLAVNWTASTLRIPAASHFARSQIMSSASVGANNAEYSHA